MNTFSELQSDIVERLFTAEQFFRGSFSDGRSRYAAVSKGWAFVQLYAAYETAVCRSVAIALSTIKGYSHPIGQLKHCIQSLVLESQVESVRRSGREKHWRSRLDLFARTCCHDFVDINDAVFPDDGSHFRTNQLKTIWEIFDISAPIVPSSRLLHVINEIVDHRNAVAHGRSKPEEIGRRYTVSEVIEKHTATRNICVHVITTLESQCADPANFLRPPPIIF